MSLIFSRTSRNRLIEVKALAKAKRILLQRMNPRQYKVPNLPRRVKPINLSLTKKIAAPSWKETCGDAKLDETIRELKSIRDVLNVRCRVDSTFRFPFDVYSVSQRNRTLNEKIYCSECRLVQFCAGSILVFEVGVADYIYKQ